MGERFKTDYPGVFFRLVERVGGPGQERVYYVLFKKNGRLLEEKAGAQYRDKMTPAKANQYRSDRIEGRRKSPQEIREEKRKAGDRYTIKRLFQEWEKRQDLKSLEQEKHRYHKYLDGPFGSKEPHELVRLDVDRVRIRLFKEKKKPQTVKLILSLLRRVVNWGHRRGYCQSLPFALEVPKVNNLLTEDLNETQLGALLQAMEESTHHQAGDVMKLALFSGMRRGEIFKLEWRDVDFERGFITLRDPKPGMDQKIPLNEASRALLHGIPHWSTSPFVFPGRGGHRRTDINKAVNEIKRKAGLPKKFRPLHGLRHTFASMLASSGEVDLYTLQKLLTHKSPSTTMRYAHLSDEALKRGSQIAASLMKNVTPKKKADVIQLNAEAKAQS